MYINRNAPESGIASLLALQGTKGDTELVHMTKPEVKLLANTGLMSMNRETGLPQFAEGGNILQTLIPMIAGVAFPALLGPSIAGALGSSALVGNAIASGLGTAFGGMMAGEDPADALTKGLIGGGLTYGLGSTFPETFGYGQSAVGEGVPNPGLSAEAGAGTGYDAFGRNVGEFGNVPSAGLPTGTEMGTGYDAFTFYDPKTFGPKPHQLLKTKAYTRFPEPPNIREDLSFSDLPMDTQIRSRELAHFSPRRDELNVVESLTPLEKYNLREGLFPGGKNVPPFVESSVDVGTEIVDNTRTGAVTETSMLDGFKDRLFDKTSLASLAGAAGAGLLVPEEQEEIKLEERPEYVPRELDYVYKRKRPSFIDGLTPRQIRELYERGGVDRRFYEGTGKGKDVFRPVAAQKGGGIEDLISISEQVGISQTPFEGKIPGQGHGMEDNVLMPILDRGGVAAVSPKEYVVPADVMAMIGNGNADDGAKEMDSFIEDFRMVKYGRPTQPPEMNGRSALQSLMKT